ncbi:MAG: hypothetical protein R3B72_43900 [Polyangiaceae bacterium]
MRWVLSVLFVLFALLGSAPARAEGLVIPIPESWTDLVAESPPPDIADQVADLVASPPPAPIGMWPSTSAPTANP